MMLAHEGSPRAGLPGCPPSLSGEVVRGTEGVVMRGRSLDRVPGGGCLLMSALMYSSATCGEMFPIFWLTGMHWICNHLAPKCIMRDAHHVYLSTLLSPPSLARSDWSTCAHKRAHPKGYAKWPMFGLYSLIFTPMIAAITTWPLH
jgi:hypothetical protein